VYSRAARPGSKGTGWWAQDYTLDRALGVADNCEAEDLVRDHVRRRPATRGRRYRFGSEHGCFFVDAATKDDIDALAAAVAELVAAGPHPDAVPGPMTDSQLAIRAWDQDDPGQEWPLHG
jgi:hypothetical protein